MSFRKDLLKARIVVITILIFLPLFLLFQNAVNSDFVVQRDSPLLPSLQQVKMLQPNEAAIKQFIKNITPEGVDQSTVDAIHIKFDPTLENAGANYKNTADGPTITIKQDLNISEYSIEQQIEVGTNLGHEYLHHLEDVQNTGIGIRGTLQDEVANQHTGTTASDGYFGILVEEGHGYGGEHERIWDSSEYNAYSWNAAANAKLASECFAQSCASGGFVSNLLNTANIQATVAGEMMTDVTVVSNIGVQNSKAPNTSIVEDFAQVRPNLYSFSLNGGKYYVEVKPSGTLLVTLGVPSPAQGVKPMSMAIEVDAPKVGGKIDLSQQTLTSTAISTMAQVGGKLQSQIAQSKYAYNGESYFKFNLFMSSYDNNVHSGSWASFHFAGEPKSPTMVSDLIEGAYKASQNSSVNTKDLKVTGMASRAFVAKTKIEQKLSQKNISKSTRNDTVRLGNELQKLVKDLNNKRVSAGILDQDNAPININDIVAKANSVTSESGNPANDLAASDYKIEIKRVADKAAADAASAAADKAAANTIAAQAAADAAKAQAATDFSNQYSKAKDTYDSDVYNAYKTFFKGSEGQNSDDLARQYTDEYYSYAGDPGKQQLLLGLFIHGSVEGPHVTGLKNGLKSAFDKFKGTVKDAVDTTNLNLTTEVTSISKNFDASVSIVGIGQVISAAVTAPETGGSIDSSGSYTVWNVPGPSGVIPLRLQDTSTANIPGASSVTWATESGLPIVTVNFTNGDELAGFVDEGVVYGHYQTASEIEYTHKVSEASSTSEYNNNILTLSADVTGAGTFFHSGGGIFEVTDFGGGSSLDVSSLVLLNQ
jgi:hypothetical protein